MGRFTGRTKGGKKVERALEVLRAGGYFLEQYRSGFMLCGLYDVQGRRVPNFGTAILTALVGQLQQAEQGGATEWHLPGAPEGRGSVRAMRRVWAAEDAA